MSVDLRDVMLLPHEEWRDAYEGEWQRERSLAVRYVTEAPSREDALLRANVAINDVAMSGMEAIDLQGEIADELAELGIDWQARWREDQAEWDTWRREQIVAK